MTAHANTAARPEAQMLAEQQPKLAEGLAEARAIIADIRCPLERRYVEVIAQEAENVFAEQCDVADAERLVDDAVSVAHSLRCLQTLRDDLAWVATDPDPARLGWDGRRRLGRVAAHLIPDEASRQRIETLYATAAKHAPLPEYEQGRFVDAAQAGRISVLRHAPGREAPPRLAYQWPPSIDGNLLTEDIGRAVVVVRQKPTAEDVEWLEREVGISFRYLLGDAPDAARPELREAAE